MSELRGMRLALSKIRFDGGTQPRGAVDAATVAAYVEALGRGAKFPPIVLFFDGAEYWCADGFHRAKAWAEYGAKVVPCEVHQGDQRAAVLYSVSANAEHGKPRTNKDKRRAVLTLLNDEEWGKRTDRWVAEHCKVDHKMVATVRAELGNSPVDDGKREGKDGKLRRMPAPKPRAKPAPAEEAPTVEEPADAEPPDEVMLEFNARNEVDSVIRKHYRALPLPCVRGLWSMVAKWERLCKEKVREHERTKANTVPATAGGTGRMEPAISDDKAGISRADR